METDRYGLPLSTGSSQAAAHYRAAHDLMLSAWPGVIPELDRAISADPDFALAHAARARALFVGAKPAEARAAIADAVRCIAIGSTEREKSHVATLEHAVSGRSADALRTALVHIDAWPRDALIFSLPLGAFGLFAFSGRADHDSARVELCERHARHFAPDDWWFTSNLGWALTEAGDPARGRPLSERSFALRRHNANAVHMLAHAMFEEGDGEATDRLVTEWLPEYGRAGILYSHISWHQALAALDDGDATRALAIYTERIAPDVTAAVPLNVISDTAAFLWRLKAYGHEVPARLWTDADEYARVAFPNAGFPFADVHMAMLEAATGDGAALDARISGIEALIVSGKLAAGPVVPAICRAFRAFADGDHQTVVSTLTPLMPDVARIGGSHAQREVVEDTLLVSLMKSGDATAARARLDERLHRRPSGRDERWRAALGH